MALYTKTELEKSTITELKTLAKENRIDIEKSWKKADLVEALLAVEEPEEELDEELDEELEEELEDEDEVELDDEELPDEDEEVDEVEEEKPAKAKAPAKKSSKKTEGDEGNTLAAKQVATILSKNLGINVEAKTLRQFFRSPASTIEPVGSGGRYEFLETDIPTIQKEFEAWKAGHASRGTKREGGGRKGRRGSDAPVEIVEEVEEIEELEFEDDLDDELDDEELELEDED